MWSCVTGVVDLHGWATMGVVSAPVAPTGKMPKGSNGASPPFPGESPIVPIGVPTASFSEPRRAGDSCHQKSQNAVCWPAATGHPSAPHSTPRTPGCGAHPPPTRTAGSPMVGCYTAPKRQALCGLNSDCRDPKMARVDKLPPLGSLPLTQRLAPQAAEHTHHQLAQPVRPRWVAILRQNGRLSVGEIMLFSGCMVNVWKAKGTVVWWLRRGGSCPPRRSCILCSRS